MSTSPRNNHQLRAVLRTPSPQTRSVWTMCVGLFALWTVCSAGLAAEPNRATTGETPVEMPNATSRATARWNVTTRDAVVVAIRPNVQLDARVIRLIDVATITGGDAGLRNQLKMLDLDDGLAAGESITILPPQIEFRMRLAGIDVDRVLVKGNGVRVTARTGGRREPLSVQTTTITAPLREIPAEPPAVAEDESLETAIVRAARELILARLPWPESRVEIRLAQPLPADVRQIDSAEGYTCEAEVRSSGPLVGRVHVRVVADSRQRTSFDVPLILDVRHFDDVVLTTRSVDRGHILTDADLYIDRRDVTELSDYCTAMNELVGRTTKRAFRALIAVRPTDVDSTNPTGALFVIKRRDQVKMVARSGALNVTATGEALQDGRLGETIRLRNVDSNSTVQGRVTGPGEVEIAF